MSTLAVNTITNAAGGNTAQINGMTPTAQSLQGFRNRLINSDMRIDQRNAGASVTIGSAGSLVYTLDRWAAYCDQNSKFSVQQTPSGTGPTGFTSYLGATSLSAYSVGASEAFGLQQTIEGFNTSDLAWGTASASAVTLSFSIYTSLTGTFGGSLRNSANNRSYPFSYTVSSANTWTSISITIPGDTAGTWLATNGAGIKLWFSLGAGSTFSGTAGAWAAANLVQPTGAVSVVGTSGATFYITGVQLEAGSVATPFERRPYGTELALCQRYCQNIRSAEGNGPYLRYAYGECGGTTGLSANVNLFATMRITPSLTIPVASSFGVFSRGNVSTCSAVAIGGDGSSPAIANVSGTTSGLTVGSAGALLSNNNNTSYLLFTAEL